MKPRIVLLQIEIKTPKSTAYLKALARRRLGGVQQVQANVVKATKKG